LCGPNIGNEDESESDESEKISQLVTSQLLNQASKKGDDGRKQTKEWNGIESKGKGRDVRAPERLGAKPKNMLTLVISSCRW
jgi:hypothetical protein